MKAMTQSAVAIVSVAVATSLAACDQSSPDKSSMTQPPANTASSNSTMAPQSSMPSTPPSSTSQEPDKTAAADSSSSMTGNTKAAPSDKSATPGKAGAPGNDDAALTTQVKTALQSEPSLRSQSIDVDTRNATVTLSGAVDSAATKAKANEVAAAVNGVVAVVDHITIKAS
jgi:hypothetical protein